MNITVNCAGVNRVKPRPLPCSPPKPYNVYEDEAGNQFVLTQESAGGIFFALKLGAPLSVALLSSANIERLQLIGRASLQP